MKTFALLSALFSISSLHAQIKIHADTSGIVKGTGIVRFVDQHKRSFGFETHKNGHLNGVFYLIDTSGNTALKGELRYDPACMNRYPGTRITFLGENNDTLSMVVDSTLAKDMIAGMANNLISIKPDSTTEQISMVHPEIQKNFNDPAVIPVGKWQHLNLKEHYIFEEILLDDCGNTTDITYFNPDGTVLKKMHFSAKPKHKKYW